MSGAIFPGSSLPEHSQQTRTKDSKAQHGRSVKAKLFTFYSKTLKAELQGKWEHKLSGVKSFNVNI